MVDVGGRCHRPAGSGWQNGDADTPPGTDAEIWIAVSKALVTTKRDDFPPAHRRKDQAIEARRLQ